MFATVHSEPAVIGATRGGMRCCNVCNAIYRNDFQRCPTDGGELAVMVADPLVGKTICEHYMIDALIGEGAMGRVYRAHHVRLLHKRYAIKVMLGDLAASAAMRMRFQHEAEAASRLAHPSIVGVVDFGRTREGLMFLVMDLVEGPTLRRLVRDGGSASAKGMTTERVIGLARQLAEGLAHAHSRGVVHRDLKPDNVLVVGDSARIADFGLAISVTSEDARLTTSGIFCTPLYAAPEQLLGKEIDHRVDLYALGTTMFEMLTGLPPFQGDANQVMAKKLACAAPKVVSLAPSVSAPLAALVDRLLARKPGGRPGHASEVIEALEQIAHGTAPARSWRRSALAIAAVASAFTVMEMSGVSRIEIAMPANASHDVAAPKPELDRAEVAPPAKLPEPESPPPSPSPRIPMTLARTSAPPPEMPAATAHTPLVEAVERAKASLQAAPRIALAPVRPTAPITKPRHRTPHADVAPHIVGLDVAGALSPSVVRRAVERVLPSLRGCATQVGARVVVASFAIGETRRASGLQVGGRGSHCLASAFSSVRTEVMPDFGDVAVQVKVAF